MMEQVNCQLKHKVQKIVGAWYLKQNKAMQYHLFMIVLAECSSSYSLIFWIFCAVSVSVSVDAGETGGGKLQKFEMNYCAPDKYGRPKIDTYRRRKCEVILGRPAGRALLVRKLVHAFAVPQ